MNYRYRQAPPLSHSSRTSSHRYRSVLLFVAAAVVGFAVGMPAALAQSSRTATVKTETKTAAALGPAQQAEVTGFVSGQVKNLTAADVTAQQRARDALARESASAGGASPAYQTAYATALNSQLLPLAKSPNVRTRLNAAIALQKVARNAGAAAAALEPATVEFVKDNSEAVALWGIKASQHVLAAIAAGKSPTKTTLPAEIVKAAQKFGTAGDLTEDAYRALRLDGRITNAGVPIVTGDLLKLFEWRVGRYAKQTPPRPILELSPVLFLTRGQVWDSPTGKPLQPRIAQQLANLVGFASQHAVAREELAARTPFVDQLKQVGDGMIALSSRPQLKEWEKVGKSLKAMSNSTPEGDFTDRAAEAFDAMKAAFPNLTPVPTIDEGAAVEAAEELVEEDAGGAPAADVADVAGGDGAGNAGARPAAGNTDRRAPAQPRQQRPAAPPSTDPDTAGAQY